MQPNHPGALDLAAAAAWDSGDFDLAAAYWKRLLSQSSTSDPQWSGLQAALERAQRQAQFALPKRESVTAASAKNMTASAR
jgi:cytochrome c-type biogenesis protein CcmH/NrfG